MTQELTIDALRNAVAGTAAAFRCRRTLEPAGGPGDKVFPPTYAGAVYAVEERRIRREDGTAEVVPCVLLDSVQSQANRMEEALQEAVDAGLIQIPVIEVRFPDDQLLQPVGRVTSLQAPHRLADAILRDSVVVDNGADKGKEFRDSSYADRWRRASAANATPLYELCPTALVFGMWGAPEKPGGLGAKFARALVSEIVGVNASVAADRSRGIRMDPLGIVKNATVEVSEGNRWRVAEKQTNKGKRPSEINHGPILFDTANSGVTVQFAEQVAVLSLVALRRLRFPPNGTPSQPDEQHRRDNSARTVLAALGLCAANLAAEKGLDLRSRCLLWPDGSPEWELLHEPGKEVQRFHVDGDSAINLLRAAVETATKAGVIWREEPLQLQASDELVKLVTKSQELAVQEAGEERAAS